LAIYIVHDRIRLIDAEGSARRVEAPNARLNTYHIRMGLCHVRVPDTPEQQEKVAMLLPLPHLLNRAPVIGHITVVRRVVLEEFFLPVIVTVCLLKELIVRDGYMLSALNLGIRMTIVIYNVSTAMHHLSELQGLLCKCTGAIIFPCNRVRNGQNMEAEFDFGMRLVRCTTCLNLTSLS
jgi:hypothetical protein